MIDALVQAWEYTSNDRILHFLPLHHVHGILNKLLCVLSVGGTVDFNTSPKALKLWKTLAKESHTRSVDDQHKPLTLFMAVPTIYSKLLEEVEKVAARHNLSLPALSETLRLATDSAIVAMMNERNEVVSKDSLTIVELRDALLTVSSLRLMVSGSAALPDTVMNSWKTLTGHTLLERYGMTEIAMALSNPYKGKRRVGCVGTPLPLVQCRLVDDQGETIEAADVPGEIRIKVSEHSVYESYVYILNNMHSYINIYRALLCSMNT